MKVLTALGAVLFMLAVLWLTASAPCELWTYSTVGNVPARCVMEK